MKQTIQLINADVIDGLKFVEKNSIDTIITSPPYYGLRDYHVDGQIGAEPTLEEYHDRLLEVTAEIWQILKPTGVVFWNHGDSYGANKCLTMQNIRLVARMIDEQGWILRNQIIWHKNNGMPSSATDRLTNKYEPVYMLTKSENYWFDLDTIRIPHKTTPCVKKNSNIGEYAGFDRDRVQYHQLGKNPGDVCTINSPEDDWKQLLEIMSKEVGFDTAITIFESYMESRDLPGDVWNINTKPTGYAHFATFPPDLIKPMIMGGCPAKICPKCGFVRERIIEEIRGDKVSSLGPSKSDGNHAKGGSTYRPLIDKRTIGYTSCDCDAGWIPGTVLDPFAGSGTTMKVAKELGRSATGIELSKEYCKLIKRNLLFHQYTLGNIENIFTEL